MTVRLRPHHLLCILTYVGRGYSPAFTDNMNAIIGRLTDGETIEITGGPDDICAPLLKGPEPHCHRDSVTTRDRAAAHDTSVLLALTIEPGTRLTLDGTRIRNLRRAFATSRIRSACGGCEWNDLCGSVSASGFAGADL
ncbi:MULTISPECIES: DUF1284 domain-containing protein [Roseobacteraceae]|uniref:(2Fe-2S) ferredoxin n=1 Tax=Pseudosulfitobacter pseudonitzschiae TaxID=1402135 RepID=A0A221JWA5_9RHOB|nr:MULTISPECIES: DUF1284 domain-containing protein [Roseobacteraceae]ASM70972.1 (2Fe-2S) ferredoxin [Pseudosulfitobacter pseudonitzschiae]